MPSPRKVTVVSPPDKIQAGGETGRPARRASFAICTCIRATSRVSPSIVVDRTNGRYPNAFAFKAAASTDSALLPIITFRTRANTSSPGFGVSTRGTGRDSASLNRANISSASNHVVGSGAVGPLPIVDRSSPITSLRISVNTCAGAAARANCPPLIPDKCFRTQFISWIFAPAANIRRVNPCFSSSVNPATGSGISAEAPPLIRQITRSSASAPAANDAISNAASTPRSSGTGCAASRNFTRRSGNVCPSFTITQLAVIRLPNSFSTAFAIGAQAFPAPTT